MVKLIKKTFKLCEDVIDTGISTVSKANQVLDDAGTICTEISGCALKATQQGCDALNSELALAIEEAKED